MTQSSSVPRGSEAIVDLMVDAGIRHVALNPGASFRGIQDSIVHRDGGPELVQCMHESVAVGLAQGYAKATGKPMGVLLHNVVGLQNATMSIYNAWRDRNPMMLFGGTGPKSYRRRRPWIDWIHTASTQGELIRDFVVWENEPHDIHSVPEAFARGLHAAVAAPGGPVYLCFDTEIQEEPLPEDFEPLDLGSYPTPERPAPSPASISRLAEQLLAAERPVLLAGFVAESDADYETLASLAELVGAAVIDAGVRHAFDTTHPLCATGVAGIVEEADLVIALDVDDLEGPLRNSSARIVNVTMAATRLRSWAHDFQSLVPGATVAANADATVAALVDALRQKSFDTELVAQRTRRIAERVERAREEWRRSAERSEAPGLVPLDRLAFEVGEAVRSDRFVLANGTNQRLEQRTWRLTKPRQYLGWHSGGGLGYGAPASIGASIGLGSDTIVVDIQADGDLLFLPSALWTAAHKSTPTLFVVNNNRQYGNTVEHAQKLAGLRGRTDERRYVGAGLADPPVDLAAMARSFGVWAEGPVNSADALGDALQRALTEVRAGRPALIDVLTPGF